MSAQPLGSKARLVVLISGSGSNLQALLDACSSAVLPAEVAAVISNKKDAYGLERARRAGVPACHMPKPKELDRRVYDASLAEQVSAYHPDWVLLRGWMRLLSSDFLNRFPQRVINLHPALPGTFPGAHAIQDAFDAYCEGRITATGVMVHLVPDEGIDCGPVLGVQNIPIYPEDSLQTLEQRIHTAEHRLVIDVLKQLL